MTDQQIQRVLGGSADAPILTFERRYRTDAAGLWSALTEPDRIARWFGRFDGPPPAAVGDRFRIDLGGENDVAQGRVTACDAARHLAYDWQWQGERPSTVTVDLAPEGELTTLLLTHRLAESAHIVGYGGGWEDMLMALDQNVGSAVAESERAAAEHGGRRAWAGLAAAAATVVPLKITHESTLTPGQVWSAFTTVDGLSSWWWTTLDTVYAVDLYVGGHYRFEARAGGFAVSGTYLVVDPESNLAFSWVWSDEEGDGVTDRVDVHIEPQGTGSLVRIEHRGPWPEADQAANYLAGWRSVLSALD